MKRVLVTGGAGYIGSHTVRELQRCGYDPIVLDNFIYGHKYILENVLKVPYVKGQVGDKKLLDLILSGNHPSFSEKKVEAIIHFAAYAYVNESIKDPYLYYQNNLIETFHLLETLLKPIHKIKEPNNSNNLLPIIFSSTCATYGIPKKNEIPIAENTLQIPINPYGRTKLVIENMLNDFYKAYGLCSISLRYFNAAGADANSDLGENHNPETHLIPLILDALSGYKDHIEIFGDDYPTADGTCIRDYIHVTDLAKAHVKALDKIISNGGCQSYNLGTGKGYSVKEVINTARVITKKDLIIKLSKRREGDPPILIASPKKAFESLSWKPICSDIKTIIRDAWNWHKVKNNI